MTSHHAQFLMHALSAAVNMRGTAANVEHGKTKLRALELQIAHREQMQQTQLSHDREMFSLKADLMRDLIHALIEQRLDAVRHGFDATLKIYADQSRHYMEQKTLFQAQLFKATTPGERADYRTCMTDADIHLTEIRADAANLNREMNKVVLLIGGTMPPMSPEDRLALGF